MNLTPIAVAFALVAVVFNVAGLVTARWHAPPRTEPQAGAGPSPAARVFPAATFEALVLTLVAALWFGSLGHGGWVILFLLLGALPAGDRWLRRRLHGAPAGGEAGLFVASLLKYLLAGLVCVWQLT